MATDIWSASPPNQRVESTKRCTKRYSVICLSVVSLSVGFALAEPPRLPIGLKLVSANRGLSVEEESKLLRVVQARQTFAVSGQLCSVAVIDTGIYGEHSDFTSRVYVQLDFTRLTNGVPKQGAPDLHGHGTAVAGIIAGNRPGPDVGIAPDARIVALRVYDDLGNTTWAAVAAALKWARLHASEWQLCAINYSSGDANNYRDEAIPRAKSDYSDVTSELDKLYNLNIPVITSAGNGYFKQQQEGMMFPAVLHTIISVGAVSGTRDASVFEQFEDDSSAFRTGPNFIAPFSQRLLSVPESKCTTIFAPGANVATASITGPTDQKRFSGTSDATPLVTGVVVLMNEYYRQHTKDGSPMPITKLLLWLRAGFRTTDSDDGQDAVRHIGKPFVRLDALCALRAESRALANTSDISERCL
jgi:subtilisin family serine protease